MTLIATAGSSSANSYATLAEAEAYMATLQFKTAWTGADSVKEAALQNATRLLDAELDYKGVAINATQALQWPRWNVLDRNGYPVDPTTIPAALKNATAEFAFRLLEGDRAKDAGAIVPSRLKAGSLELENLKHRIVPDSVLALMRDLLAGGSDQPVPGRS